MNNKNWTTIEIGFVPLAVSAALGITVIALLLFLLPDHYNAAPALCIGWAVFLAMSLYLGKAFEGGALVPEYVAIAMMSVQLILLGVLAPWFGWSNDVIGSWFGRFFFAIYFMSAILVIPLGSLFRKYRRSGSPKMGTERDSTVTNSKIDVY